jgi:tetratricopeptide (TPR) repeat protein
MRRDLFICLLLAGITLAIYWPVGRLGFINDDDEGPRGYIVDNTNIQAGITAKSVAWAFTTTQACNWHPVTWLSHMLDYKLFGLKAGGHHWMNLGFHIANSLLLFIVLRQMTQAVWRSALVAALFACHPLHIQSVAWISERKDVLSAFFFLLTLWAWVRHVQKRARVEPSSLRFAAPKGRGSSETVLQAFDPRRWTLDYCMALLFFTLGLMSKPMLVTLPLILLLLDFWPFGRITNFEFLISKLKGSREHPADNQSSTLNRLLREKLPFLGLAMVSSIVTVWAQNEGGAVVGLNRLPLDLRLENVLVSYVTYLEKTFWPANLAIYYPYTGTHPWEALGSGLLLIGLSIFSLWRMHSQPYLLAGWFWFVVMLLPVIGIVQVGSQSMADRYMYLPSIGLFIMVAWGMAGLACISRFWRIGMALGATALVLACLPDTRYQLRYWRDSVTLFSHAIEVTGENFNGNYYLANAFWTAGNLDEAAKNYEYVTRVSPDFEEGHYWLGRVLLLQKKSAEAQAQFSGILRLDPSNPFPRKFLGDILSAQEKFADAEAEYALALQLKPGDPVIQEALQRNRFLETLQLKPDSPDVLNNLAWLLATSQIEQTHDGAQAVKYAQRACELTHYRETIMVGTLAAAYAAAGRFEEAIATAEKACALASESGEQDWLKKNQELLELYRAHRPYHEATEKLVPTAP